MSSPPSEGGFYLPEHPAPSDPHSLSDEIVGNEAQPEAVPWNLPSARTPNQPMGVEPSRSTAGATETANHVQNTPGGKRKPRKKREEFKAFLAAVGLPTEIGIWNLTKYYSSRRIPSAAVPPVWSWFHRRGTSAVADKKIGGNARLLNLGA